MFAAALLLSLQAMIAPPAPPPVPLTESEVLGIRLAHSGVLAAALPLMATSSVEAVVRAHPELSEPDRAALRTTAQRVAARETDRVLYQEGRAYARALSLADLRTLTAAAESPAARRHRAALPQVIAATMQAVGSVDLGVLAWAEFCAQPGRRCAARPVP